MQLDPLAGGCSAVVKTPQGIISEIDGQGRVELDPTDALFEAAEDWSALSKSVCGVFGSGVYGRDGVPLRSV
eukprot:4635295-Pyramimonas_sp.AAC.1